ncbi:MAG: CDP-alcohol phosphatidyltransferase family protein, partial [Oceanidesulfovibrio sp.]
MTPRPGRSGGDDARERIRQRVEEKLRPLTVPNFLTLLRMAMIPFLVIAISQGDYRLAVWTFVAAGLTDALDGFLARRFDSHSVIGAYLDPIADKLLLT